MFAKDGEALELDGKKAVVMGGAYSIDKMVRLIYGYGKWLDGMEDRLEYGRWYCGDYHMEKKIDKLEIMFENLDVFCGRKAEE